MVFAAGEDGSHDPHIPDPRVPDPRVPDPLVPDPLDMGVLSGVGA